MRYVKCAVKRYRSSFRSNLTMWNKALPLARSPWTDAGRNLWQDSEALVRCSRAPWLKRLAKPLFVIRRFVIRDRERARHDPFLLPLEKAPCTTMLDEIPAKLKKHARSRLDFLLTQWAGMSLVSRKRFSNCCANKRRIRLGTVSEMTKIRDTLFYLYRVRVSLPF